MEDGEKKKGFTIRDRRVTAQQQEEAAKEERAQKEVVSEKKGEVGERSGAKATELLPEMDFSAFIFSLSTSALLHLGEVPDPVTQKREKNLPLARQTIDILGMLREKTRGNLTPEEGKMLDHLLADLRWRYIGEAKG